MIGLKISGVCDSESGIFIVFFFAEFIFRQASGTCHKCILFLFLFCRDPFCGFVLQGGIFFEDTIYESEKQESKWRRIVAHRFAFKFFVAGILSGESLFA